MRFARFHLILPVFLWLSGTAQDLAVVSGHVHDLKAGRVPLAGASIVVKGSVLGTITDGDGNFSLKPKTGFPITLVVSFIGFKTQEIRLEAADEPLEIGLLEGALLGEEVVVTASRVEESILQSPVAIEKLDIRAIQETPAPSFYDAMENVKGVQMTTSSLTFKVPNTRGFNIPNNFRFMQLADGVDMQAATLGVPLGNAIGPTELDIESVEITPGTASALYGMNAVNGMANLISKSPFLYQGLSLYQKTGVNHVDGIDYAPSILSETALRYAKAFANRLAFKVNVGYLQAVDWRGNSTMDQNPNATAGTANASYPELSVSDHPAYDAWNKYGDDSGGNAVTVSGITYNGQPNQSFIVRRTGYWEKDLVPGKVDNLKVDAALHYRPSDNLEISYSYRYGQMDGLFQRGNKVQLDNTTVQNHKLELKGANYFIRSYISIEDTGDSYNLKPLADNLDLTNASNGAWTAAFKAALQTDLSAGVGLEEAMKRARTAADAGRAEPGTHEFDALKATIIKINNWDHLAAGIPNGTATGGAWLKQRSHLYHTDAQLDLTGRIRFVDLLAGADVRVYEVIPDGNNFVDFTRPIAERTLALDDGTFGNNVYYTKYGFFVQATKKLFDERMKVVASARMDHNIDFDPKFNPRLAVVYTARKVHNFRASYQNGFRFPALFEALSFVNNGNVRRVGGLPYINEGLNYLDNSYTLASVNSFNAAVNRDISAGLSPSNAALKNKELLTVTDLAPTRPERIQSFEVGYKSVLRKNTLVIDIDAYINRYDGFLGQVEVSVPYAKTTTSFEQQLPVGSDEAVQAMLQSNRATQQTRYRVFTNAKNVYTNYGSSLGITYYFYKKFAVSGNINYNALNENSNKDVFVTGFNTPKWFTNISFANREVAKNLGFNIVYHWQPAFTWESPLANGMVASYQTIDMQMTYKIQSLKSTIKLGGSNIFNARYFQYAAGPTIGGLYYVSISVNDLLK